MSRIGETTGKHIYPKWVYMCTEEQTNNGLLEARATIRMSAKLNER